MADNTYRNDEALRFHSRGRPGKLEVVPTKPMATQRDLSLAYSPGVAAPCLEIERDPSLAYDYTSKGNLVAVISNGTAVLGLGNIGALAGKPVMEGKSVLFKRFADVDSIDLEIDTDDVDAFINSVRYLGASFGGINLEDIRAPDCFVIEQRLKELLDIPVFHDDQHGTAIIAAAGLINAMHLTNRDMDNTRLVINGAGSAGIACAELLKALGFPPEAVILCDTRGVIYQGREAGMNQWKSAHAADTKLRSFAEALKGADAVFGLSVKGAIDHDMVTSMAKNPIIFAMANPDPEVTPEEIAEVRDDAIVATGRSDYPNQVNNVLGFPYIFRGALDVRATTINDTMKVAAVHALAELARQDVPDEVRSAYSLDRMQYGPNYIIPVPFDPRLISQVPAAVAKAAMDSGVARRPVEDFKTYRLQLHARLDATTGTLQMILDRVRENPKRIVFAEGEEERVIRAAVAFRDSGYGTPVLIGLEDSIRAAMSAIGISNIEGIEFENGRSSPANADYTAFLYKRLHRSGYLMRDCQRLVNQDRNIFAACMVANGDADGMVTGMTRSYHIAYNNIRRVIDEQPGQRVFGLSIVVAKERTVFIADTTVHDSPTGEALADIAQQSAAIARDFGHDPKVALLANSNFGYPPSERSQQVGDAVTELDNRDTDFNYEGDMAADVALNLELQALFPFCRLGGSANVLVMPSLHAADLTSKLMGQLGGASLIGPLLVGLSKPAQIVPMGARVSQLVTMAALAADQAERQRANHSDSE